MTAPDNEKKWRDVRVPLWEQGEPYFQFPDHLRKTLPAQKSPWRVAPDSKSVPVHGQACTGNSMIAVYPEAIAVSSSVGRDRPFGWLLFFLGILGLMMFGWSAMVMADDLFILAVSLTMIAASLLVAAWAYRSMMHVPPERPLLFCRRSRQVSYFVPHLPSFWKFWEAAANEVRTHPWKDTHVRSYGIWMFNGVTSARQFHLCLLWGGNKDNPRTLEDTTVIGFAEPYGDERLFMLWEHIRRYMEEGGPAIPPDEKMREPANGVPLPEFPPEIIATAGGPPLSREEVAKLAGTASTTAA